MPASLSAPSPKHPSPLPTRYEIRVIPIEHLLWVSAIVSHSNVFYSPIFGPMYPTAQGARYNACIRGCDYLMTHQLQTGTSLGVYDTEYPYRTEEARAAGGKFYWDEVNDDVTATEALAAMDFPLVSVAMAYDAFHALDHEKLDSLFAALPCFPDIVHELEKRETSKAWEPTETNQLLLRQATSTRRDYEGKGIMKGMARYMMAEAARNGYREIRIDAFNAAVEQVWMNAPSPYKSVLVASFSTKDAEERKDSEGKEIDIFNGVVYQMYRIKVEL